MKVLPALLLTLAAPLAHAGCSFRSMATIICNSPEAAAVAYKEFGFDTSVSGTSYNNALLHRAGCGAIFGTLEENRDMPRLAQGRIPTRSGWVEVDFVKLSNGSFYWVARPYLRGECRAEPRPN